MLPPSYNSVQITPLDTVSTLFHQYDSKWTNKQQHYNQVKEKKNLIQYMKYEN